MTAPVVKSTASGSDKSVAQKGGLLDLEEQLSFYGQYHTHKVNVAIHLVCIPLIFCLLNHNNVSFGSFQLNLDPLVIPQRLHFALDFTPGTLMALAYATYFVMLEPVAGLMYAPFLLAMAYSANVFAKQQGSLSTTVALFFGGWVAQFIGHFAFEGRAPALFDNLTQSLVLAVFFVFFELMFMLGYDPPLHHRLKSRIGTEVATFRRAQAAKKRAGIAKPAMEGSALRS